jgi:hypothetical protein
VLELMEVDRCLYGTCDVAGVNEHAMWMRPGGNERGRKGA